MKKIILSLIALAALAAGAQADIITRWNFNSNPPDTSTSTGSLIPSTGNGTATVIGGAINTFASGDNRAIADPTATDNTAWNIGNLPAQGVGNKTAGVQLSVSTVGFENITVSWTHRASDTCSRYFRVQYTINGTDYIDGAVIAITNLTTTAAFQAQTNNLSGVAGIRDNPNFAIRIVSEFENTATLAGNPAYVAAKTTYAQGGLFRIEAFTVYGTVIVGGNTPPTISSLSKQTSRVDTASSPNPFTINDAETALDSLVLSGTSSNPSLVVDSKITFAGSGANRTVTVTPEAGQTGTATITVKVTDALGAFATSSFLLTVLPANTTPVISAIPHQHTVKNTSLGPVSYTISDLESAPEALTVSATSGNTTLLPNENITFGGAGGTRTISFNPAANQTGVAVVSVRVSDGVLSTNTTFTLMVVPSSEVIFYDPFTYPDGSLVANSAHLWSTHSGAPEEMQVTSGKLEVSAINSEDVNAPLIGAPYTNNSGITLYAKFTLTAVALPTGTNYFAHLKDGGAANFRARLFATTDAAEGFFRLGIANSTSTNIAVYPDNLSANTAYTVVIRYNVNTGISTLWVNPTQESDPSVTATDAVNLAVVNTFAFRESTAFGILNADDLFVGTSFAAVLPPPPAYSLIITRSGNDVTVSWPEAATTAGYFLESTPSFSPKDWQLAPETFSTAGGINSITLLSTTDNRYFRLRK